MNRPNFYEEYLMMIFLQLIIETKNVTVCEHERRRISCAKGEKLYIKGASYGRQSRDICPSPQMRDIHCRSKTSEEKVEELCDGQGKCTLHASNNVFGNPCPGTFKYLKVTYNCTINGIFLIS